MTVVGLAGVTKMKVEVNSNWSFKQRNKKDDTDQGKSSPY